jgi:uncharacterized RDD family membrane protein YckC
LKNVFKILKVLDESFDRLTTKQAILRTSIDIFFGLILTYGFIRAMLGSNVDPFEMENPDIYYDKIKNNFSYSHKILDILNYFWLVSEFIVMNFNIKKKAIHDYIANSVVVNVTTNHQQAL